MRVVAAVVATVLLVLGGIVSACGGDDRDARTFTITQTVPGVGSGGLSGTGVGETAP